MTKATEILKEPEVARTISYLPSLINMLEALESIRTNAQRRQTHLGKHVLCQDCLRSGIRRERAIWAPTKSARACPRCGSMNFIPAGRQDPFIERYLPEIKALEAAMVAELEEIVGEHPLWTEWAYAVKGLGMKTLGKIMGHCDIERLTNVSKMWAHAGLGLRSDGTLQRKIRGERIDYDQKLQSITCVMGESLLRAAGKYYDFYWSKKENYLVAGLNKGHAHNRAFRDMRKLALAHIWEVWRRVEGLPVPRPYAFDILKHSETEYIKPEEMMEGTRSRDGGR